MHAATATHDQNVPSSLETLMLPASRCRSPLLNRQPSWNTTSRLALAQPNLKTHWELACTKASTTRSMKYISIVSRINNVKNSSEIELAENCPVLPSSKFLAALYLFWDSASSLQIKWKLWTCKKMNFKSCCICRRQYYVFTFILCICCAV